MQYSLSLFLGWLSLLTSIHIHFLLVSGSLVLPNFHFRSLLSFGTIFSLNNIHFHSLLVLVSLVLPNLRDEGKLSKFSLRFSFGLGFKFPFLLTVRGTSLYIHFLSVLGSLVLPNKMQVNPVSTFTFYCLLVQVTLTFTFTL